MSEKDIDLQEEQHQGALDITELINPFPGLRPFGVEESHLFFGREGQSDEALVKLSENRFVAVLGASGSGKSSFTYCGLIPTLHGGFMTDAGSNWRVVVSRPGGGPIDNLAESLLIKDHQFNTLSEEDKLIKKTIIGTVLRSSSLGLIEVVKQLKSSDFQNVLIVIDQFEELFRFAKLEASYSDQDESSAFVNLLLEAIHQFDEPIYVALTMRSDFIGECAKYPDLTQMINDSHYLIPQMTRDQKRVAVEGPVAVGGGKIAPRLTQQLLNDVGDNPDQLPILQHALMRTWSYWVENRKPEEPMDLRHYTAVGTLREALSQHANEAFDSLSKREKEICETMFKALTERGAENQGIRRPTKLGTLAAITGVSEDEVERVVDRFREPGRSLLMPPYGVRLESDTVIDISHESLMRIWDRLKRWLDEESKASEMYTKLSEAAERFQEGKASLWQMPDLQLALNWREETRPTLVWGQRYNPAFERTMVFLETSEKAYLNEQRNQEILQRRKVRGMRITALVLGLAAMVCLFLVVYANLQTQQAKEKEKEAAANLIKAEEATKEAEKLRSEAEELAADAIREKNRADLERKAADEAKLAAQRSANDALRQKAEADRQKKAAEDASKRATESALKAKEQQLQAEAAKREADAEKARAERLRFQAIAQSMAIKAKNVPDADLKGLVAKQAYAFYQEYKDPGKNYNGDIYAGVYYGLEGLLHDTKGDSALNQYHGHMPMMELDKSGIAVQRSVAAKSVVFSKDGKSMYSAGSDGRLLSWDVKSRRYQEIFSSDNVSRVVNVSPNERWLALASDRDEIYLFDLKRSDQDPTLLTSHSGAIYDLIFLPDNSGFISVGADRRVLLSNFDGDSGKEIATTTVRIKALAVSPDGKTLAGGADSGEVFLWDLTREDNNQSELYRKDKKAVTALAFNHTGEQLAIAGSDDRDRGYIIRWDMNERSQVIPELGGFTSPVTDVEFSPADDLLAGASKDKTARFWDLNNIFDLPTVLDDHSDWVWDLSFHPEGHDIVTASKDGLIRLYPTKPDEMASRICGYLERNLSEVEWKQFVGEEIDYQSTCEGLPKPEDN
ncbi:MAG: High-affnity carbon uptake protein Hat/HatR [Cyclobacteriaceae bacterium]|nr:High-affnity carbon uptake protein Hat/HatR [Cyclobacteriaceae bacterium HetDA_MAG_MS6]